MTLYLVRYFHPQHGPRFGVQRDDMVYDFSDRFAGVAEWLRASVNRVRHAIDDLDTLISQSSMQFPAATFENSPSPQEPHWLAPVDTQDVWASGVTYIRSRAARQEEAVDGGDVYARVYDAERPELFFKAQGWQVVGHLDTVGIRRDATWSVPEPELGIVLNPAMEIVGFTVGNDMSSRDIEGENPLYLPQAKMYRRACALGHGLRLLPADALPQVEISITIERDGAAVFADHISTDKIKRSAAELIDHLGRCVDFPDGAVLLTGTGIVPPNDFTLSAKDRVTIEIDTVCTLINTVEVV